MKYSFETKFPLDSRGKIIETGLTGSVVAYTFFGDGEFAIWVSGDGSLCGEYEESELVKI